MKRTTIYRKNGGDCGKAFNWEHKEICEAIVFGRSHSRGGLLGMEEGERW